MMKPLPFYETLAHPGDPLPRHLQRVARRAAESIAPGANPQVRRIAYLAGLFHDIGKATPYFQEYLAGKRKRGALTPHAKSGAILAWWYCGLLDIDLADRISVFLAVLRHHGAMACDQWPQYLKRTQTDARDQDNPLWTQLRSMDLPGIHHWLSTGDHPRDLTATELPPLTPQALAEALLDHPSSRRSPLRKAFTHLDQALYFLAGFGALLAVDKIDAALEGGQITRKALPADMVTAYKRRHLSANRNQGLNPRRRRIADEVKDTWLQAAEQPLLTLTAPTGSGKTLAVLDAALALRQRLAEQTGQAPRLIYCLPFTSVIDQNHEVFNSVLASAGIQDREDLLLKHHHLVEGLFRDADHEYDVDGAGQLLTESWQSEMVVTTFYQLLHTLLSNKNANLKRAAQLSGAIVLMDEVQALPLRYWLGLRHLFQAAARALDTRFVLLTATRPLIFRPQDAQELLPSHHEQFAALSRVELHCHHHTPEGLGQFSARLEMQLTDNQDSVLIIVNRRRAVQSLFKHLHNALPDRRIVALSTDLTPKDRRARIRLIQRLQRNGLACIVISTQLIEAGVDLSFPVVHRDLAPLDSIIQAAGRCNRHAVNNARGEVHLWQLHADKSDGSNGAALWTRVYDSPLIDATKQVLGDRQQWQERDFLDLSQAYFDACWGRMDQEPIEDWLAAGDFERLQRDVQLIPEGPPQQTVFISSTPMDERLWWQYRDIQEDDDLSPLDKDRLFRRLRKRFYERVIQVYAYPDPEEPIRLLRQQDASYSRETGFIGLPEDSPSCIF